jgi:nicotinamidase-related amidase
MVPSTRRKERSAVALVLVDLQNDFVDPNGAIA